MNRAERIGIALLLLLLMGGCGNSRKIAEAGTREFRQRTASGQFAAIYEEAAPELRKATSEANWMKLMAMIRLKLGAWQSSQAPAWRASIGTAGRTVSLGYSSKFEKGDAREELLWRIKDGHPILLGYHVNSQVFLAK